MSAPLRLVHEALEGAVAFLEPLLPLANSCMVNFITEDQWRRLVPARLAAALLGLPRDQLLQLPLLAAPPTPAAPALPLLDQFFSDKKLHEVDRMAATVAHLAAESEISQVVDMGSGKGYLSSMLALSHGLDVMAVEANEVHTHGAKKVNANLKKSWDAIVSRTASLRVGETPAKRSKKWKRQHRSAGGDRHRPQPGRLTPVDQFVSSGTELAELVTCHGDPALPLAVVGLHTCGDLAVHSLRMFSQLPQARLLVNVGCCYHLQRERFEGDFWRELDPADETFPLCSLLTRRRYVLGQQARGLAAQASERMASYQRSPSPALYYRAVLQVYLRDKLGAVPTDVMVGRLARKAKGYLDYMHMALSKYPLDHRAVPDAELLAYHDRLLEHQPRLEAFSVLRASLAPVVEAVILLDRLAFLLEQGSVASAELVQLFEPVTSPRCYALIATKRRRSGR
ncbi:methyltransferase-like protein 25 [Pollicipes pollicipes]|uniref:methyltransferase-like protein 25 n=1 Tax=Pollicipes pollicipes TaxID=41117 RepID=UPI00188491D1|nr:methyltransferase-like protein 25 [Pollicipes pollicipes]